MNTERTSRVRQASRVGTAIGAAIVMVVATFATISVATAGDGATEGKRMRNNRSRRAGKRLARRFAKLDKNGDGVLTKDEVPEQAWTRLQRADRDGDGSVSNQELRAALKIRRGKRQKRTRKKKMKCRLKQLDSNGDGALAKDEVPEKAWARLATLDTDGNLVVTREEIRARRKARAEARFARADKNGDGALSKDELPSRGRKRMAHADSNDDGVVTLDEIRAAQRARVEKRKGEAGQ